MSRWISFHDQIFSAVASSLPAGAAAGSAAGSTYIRSQYNLNPPPAHSPDPLPGYCSAHPGSDTGPPSTIGEFQWGNTTGGSSIDGGSVMGSSCTGQYHPGQGPQVYLSSAMSTSSADSGSVSGSGSRTCGSNSGGSGSAGGGPRRPSNFKSFTNHPPPGMMQPKAVFGE